VEDIELDGEILSKQEQTVVLGLQSGKSWAEVEAKLRATYSGTSV
jgi:hypothetical protein